MKIADANNSDKDKLQVDLELKKIGKKLRRLRKDLGYSSPDVFSYDNNINRSQYGKYEAGSEDMRFSSLIKLLNIHGIRLSEFFNEDYENSQ